MLPWDHICTWVFSCIVFTGLAPGFYLLERDPHSMNESACTRERFSGNGLRRPEHLPLYCLIEVIRDARTVSCHQDIASDGAFSLGMIADFAQNPRPAPGGIAAFSGKRGLWARCCIWKPRPRGCDRPASAVTSMTIFTTYLDFAPMPFRAFITLRSGQTR